MNQEDAVFWGRSAPGVGPGSQGMDMFQQRAARLLSTLPYSLVFQSSRIVNGEIQYSQTKVDNDGNASFSGTEGDARVHVLVQNDKISNLYNPNGSVNQDVLRVCLQRLEGIAVVMNNPTAKKDASLSDKFTATTGRDRLLDFMRTKARDARGNEAYKPPREVVLGVHAEINKKIASERATHLAQLKAAGLVADDPPAASPK